jgi:single-strand DNA-binding protein
MYETHITIIGNLLTAPEWRRTTNSGRLVTSFKVAASTRRLDRASGQWMDGNGLRVRVTCWRDLAGGVASSLMVGDPVIVHGQIYTRDWMDAEGVKRTLYEMEAVAVGHNLARGRSRFARNKPASASEIEPDPADPVRLGGELTEPAPEQRVGLAPDDPLQGVDDVGFDGYGLGYDDPFGALPASPGRGGFVRLGGDGDGDDDAGGDDDAAGDSDAAEGGDEAEGSDAVEGGDAVEAGGAADEEAADEEEDAVPDRRRRKRTPVRV